MYTNRKYKELYRFDTRSPDLIEQAGGFSPNKEHIGYEDTMVKNSFSTFSDINKTNIVLTESIPDAMFDDFNSGDRIYLYNINADNLITLDPNDIKGKTWQFGNGAPYKIPYPTDYLESSEVAVIGRVYTDRIKLHKVFELQDFDQYDNTNWKSYG